MLFLAAHNFRLKGVPQLLRVAAKLLANRRPVHVVIAGGKHLEQWKLSAARVGLAKRATFLGTIIDLVPYYAAADAYVDLMDAGVLDPTKVSRTALQHAASVVGLLLTTEVLIAEASEAPTAPYDGMSHHRGSMGF